MTSPLRSARVAGTFSTLYKQSLMARLLSRMNENPLPYTYHNFHGGSPAYLLANTYENFPAIYLHRWLNTRLGLKRVPQDIDHLKPYLTRFRDVNRVCNLDEYGFASELYIPGDAGLVASFLRPGDKAYFFENRSAQASLLRAAFEEDPKVKVLHENVDDEYVIRHTMPPAARRGIVHYDLGDSPTYAEQLQVRNLLYGGLKRFPEGIHVVTYPIKKGYLPWQVIRGMAATGVRNAYNFTVYADFGYQLKKFQASIPTVDTSKLPESLTHEEVEAVKDHADNVARVASAMDLHMLEGVDAYTLREMKPNDSWEGVGVAILNAPYGFNEDARKVCNSLKEIMGLPQSNPTQRFSPIHAPAYTEMGESATKYSISIEGPPLPDAYRRLPEKIVNQAMLHQFRTGILPRFAYQGPAFPPVSEDDLLNPEVNDVITETVFARPVEPATFMSKKEAARISAKMDRLDRQILQAADAYVPPNPEEVSAILATPEDKALDGLVKATGFRLRDAYLNNNTLTAHQEHTMEQMEKAAAAAKAAQKEKTLKKAALTQFRSEHLNSARV